MEKIKNMFAKPMKWELSIFMPGFLGGARELASIPRTSVSPIPKPKYPTLPMFHSDGSISLTSSFSSSSSSSASYNPVDNYIRNNRVKFVVVHSRFSWYDILLAMSFGVPVALLSVTYDNVGGNLVPAKLFTSTPLLFHVFIILDAIACTASVIGFLLHRMHVRTSKYLSVFAFVSLMSAFCVYLWVLLPGYLKWFPCLPLLLVTLTLFYMHFHKGNKHYLDEYNVDSVTFEADRHRRNQ